MDASVNQGVVKKRTPPVKVPASKQYELFTEFFGDHAEHSNTIELWDSIPKYAVNLRRQSNLRNEQGRLPVHEYNFVYTDPKKVDHDCRIEVQPASIKTKGGFRDFYPSAADELVEEVLRKIFADANYGLHTPRESESWVKFSLSMIRKELKTRGKTRSIDEIKRSIEILARTTIALYKEDDDTPVYTAPILADLTRVNRAAYLDDPKALWIARLPALVSKSVNELTYRQINYGTLMSFDSQLARWLHKKLSHRYIYASWNKPFNMLLSSIKRDSGLLETNRVTKDRQKLEEALDQLKDAGVLLDWTGEERRGEKNAIVDVLYTLQAHPDFTSDMKAANARRSDAEAKLEGRGSGRATGHKLVGGQDSKR